MAARNKNDQKRWLKNRDRMLEANGMLNYQQGAQHTNQLPQPPADPSTDHGTRAARGSTAVTPPNQPSAPWWMQEHQGFDPGTPKTGMIGQGIPKTGPVGGIGDRPTRSGTRTPTGAPQPWWESALQDVGNSLIPGIGGLPKTGPVGFSQGTPKTGPIGQPLVPWWKQALHTTGNVLGALSYIPGLTPPISTPFDPLRMITTANTLAGLIQPQMNQFINGSSVGGRTPVLGKVGSRAFGNSYGRLMDGLHAPASLGSSYGGGGGWRKKRGGGKGWKDFGYPAKQPAWYTNLNSWNYNE